MTCCHNTVVARTDNSVSVSPWFSWSASPSGRGTGGRLSSWNNSFRQQRAAASDPPATLFAPSYICHNRHTVSADTMFVMPTGWVALSCLFSLLLSATFDSQPFLKQPASSLT